MEIKIKYTEEGITPIEKISKGDWIDLRCAKDTFIKAGCYEYVSLGVCMELPKGYEALIAPRSSSLKTWNTLQGNSISIIDESYCGDNDEWKIPLYAIKDTYIKKNERICQFRILEHQPEIEFIEVESLGNPDRGGFGSTGVK